MIVTSSKTTHLAGTAFDSIAEQYDDIFTHSLIGRAQRNAVRQVLRETFRSGQHVLELNCGTGEDALFLASMGVSVFACDASERMITVAARRVAAERRGAQVQLEMRSSENIGGLRHAAPFDGVLSNFSGLNCVSNLASMARQLAGMVRSRGQLVLCLSSRVCLWETLWFLAQRQPHRAIRRWRGATMAQLGEIQLAVQYPTMSDIQKAFAPAFAVRQRMGIGVTVPPSYLEHLARRFPQLLIGLTAIDRRVATWPGFRSLGDHTLLVLERTDA